MSEQIVRIPELSLTLESIDTEISVQLHARSPTIAVELDAIGVIYPEYAGPYQVTPSASVQTLATRDHVMTDDFSVLEIPYFETSNLSGGYTAIIGG